MFVLFYIICYVFKYWSYLHLDSPVGKHKLEKLFPYIGQTQNGTMLTLFAVLSVSLDLSALSFLKSNILVPRFIGQWVISFSSSRFLAALARFDRENKSSKPDYQLIRRHRSRLCKLSSTFLLVFLLKLEYHGSERLWKWLLHSVWHATSPQKVGKCQKWPLNKEEALI